MDATLPPLTLHEHSGMQPSDHLTNRTSMHTLDFSAVDKGQTQGQVLTPCTPVETPIPGQQIEIDDNIKAGNYDVSFSLILGRWTDM